MQVRSLRDPHDILGVNAGADEHEVKKAYRKLALRWHPDVNPDDLAEAKFKALREAYELLIGKGSQTGKQGPIGGNWEFHDWYWSFSWRQRQARAGEASSRNLGHEHRHSVRSQVANLKRRAAARQNSKAGVSEAFAANMDEDIECILHWEGRGAGFESASEYDEDDFFYPSEAAAHAAGTWSSVASAAAHPAAASSGTVEAALGSRDAMNHAGAASERFLHSQAAPFASGTRGERARRGPLQAVQRHLADAVQAASSMLSAHDAARLERVAPASVLSFAGTAMQCVTSHHSAFTQAATQLGSRLGLRDDQHGTSGEHMPHAGDAGRRHSELSHAVRTPVVEPLVHALGAQPAHSMRSRQSSCVDEAMEGAPRTGAVAVAERGSTEEGASTESQSHARRPLFVATEERRTALRSQLTGLKRRAALREQQHQT